MESATPITQVKWAQRKATVFITIEAQDLSEEDRVIELTPEGHLHFSGKSKNDGRRYHVDLDLYEAVVLEETKWKVTDLHVQFNISKKDKEASYWPRLTKQNQKLKWISCDWNKWIDEDDEAESLKKGFDAEGFEDLPDYDDSDDEEEEEAPEGLEDLDKPAEDVEESKE